MRDTPGKETERVNDPVLFRETSQDRLKLANRDLMNDA